MLADFDGDDVKTNVVPSSVGIGMGTHSAVALGGFQDFCLKSELANAIRENGFEHPSEVQHQALPKAMLGSDILAQAKSGMGKTAVFVFALLEQIEKVPEGKKPYCQAVVLVHARELAYQIEQEFKRFNKYLPYATTGVFFGGVPEDENVRQLKKEVPAIVVGTPGRLKSLLQTRALDVTHVKWFVVDEFDRCLEDIKMRRDVQEIFMKLPKEKQVMMFSATMTDDLRNVAKKFMNNPMEIYVDQRAKLTLHGLAQFFMNLTEAEKLRKLCDILDAVEFNQVIIFTSSVERCEALNRQLQVLKFPSQAVHSRMAQEERLRVYESCKSNQTRIVVATDLFGRGVDIDRINLVVQFDMASDADSYLHRVGRAGRFGTKGLTIAFITAEEKEIKRESRKYTDGGILKEVQDRFEMQVQELTDIKGQLNESQYMNQ
ncbi:ATP-dependent RNA helicase UAP56/SUB2 [Strigomonas culicis]|uniref:ATP-dependent RNA helicase UAP56/SUB2 n=2 Tax=Strigomonas culicis TaxID=28005 RepID=S9U2A6_9TRYP|nr:ATP-dependent RNA helicase UAP56/SUB2 [Strigomonas culicis]|eukprot:EPY23073.1 ATP-dependent RNA helicase UAP56/SUB2 [Strigomonas culicis]